MVFFCLCFKTPQALIRIAAVLEMLATLCDRENWRSTLVSYNSCLFFEWVDLKYSSQSTCVN